MFYLYTPSISYYLYTLSVKLGFQVMYLMICLPHVIVQNNLFPNHRILYLKPYYVFIGCYHEFTIKLNHNPPSLMLRHFYKRWVCAKSKYTNINSNSSWEPHAGGYYCISSFLVKPPIPSFQCTTISMPISWTCLWVILP